MPLKCENCRDEVGNLTLMTDRWVCDDCSRDDRNFDIEVVEVVKVFETKVWIESDILGAKHVVLQHEGCEPFTWCTFNYDHRYTGNSTTLKCATDMAISLGASHPVEHRHRELKQLQIASEGEGV